MVAIEFGSTRIAGVAGYRGTDGTLSVSAYATEEATACIRKGVIFNIDKTAQAVTSIINRLESALDASIAKVYVGIGGQSVCTVKNAVLKTFDEDTRITADIVEELIATDRATLMGEREILEVIPQEYRVGSSLQADPVGVVGNCIEGRFLNIVARTSVRHKIEECFALAKMKIAGYFIAPMEMAKAVLTEAELRTGCALVDFGAETTTVQVYKDHILRHLSVIPLGGNNINKDICSLKIEEEAAEQLKQRHANVHSTLQETDKEPVLYTVGDDKTTTITDRLLCEIAETRQEEILANVWHRITLSGYDDKLMSGIVVTGGASLIQGLQEAFTAKTGIEKYRQALYVNFPVESVTPELLAKDGRTGTQLALLASARENCREVVVAKDLFPDPNEEEKRAEELRKKDEEIQRQKDEAARIAKEKAEQEAAERAAAAALAAKKKADEEAEQRRKEAEAEAERLRAEKEEQERIKRENSLLNKLKRWGGKIVEDMMKED